jgi:hypothetical protein
MRKMLIPILATLLFLSASPAFAGTAQGTLVAKETVALKFAYLVKGPDAIDNQKIIRRLIFSSADLSAKLQACAAMSCSDGEVTEGMTVDLVGGERFNYWMVMKGGMVQHSGTKETAALKITADDAKHLAGKLSFDDSAMGGPKADVTFDANMVKEFTKAR